MTMLGSALANILDVFNPELVVLGGGVTRAGDQLLQPVREIALRDAMAPAAGAADIVLAELGEDLGVVSAAAVAFERLPRDPSVGRAAPEPMTVAGERR
jgi:glucokinase